MVYGGGVLGEEPAPRLMLRRGLLRSTEAPRLGIVLGS